MNWRLDEDVSSSNNVFVELFLWLPSDYPQIELSDVAVGSVSAVVSKQPTLLFDYEPVSLFRALGEFTSPAPVTAACQVRFWFEIQKEAHTAIAIAHPDFTFEQITGSIFPPSGGEIEFERSGERKALSVLSLQRPSCLLISTDSLCLGPLQVPLLRNEPHLQAYMAILAALQAAVSSLGLREATRTHKPTQQELDLKSVYSFRYCGNMARS